MSKQGKGEVDGQSRWEKREQQQCTRKKVRERGERNERKAVSKCGCDACSVSLFFLYFVSSVFVCLYLHDLRYFLSSVIFLLSIIAYPEWYACTNAYSLTSMFLLVLYPASFLTLLCSFSLPNPLSLSLWLVLRWFYLCSSLRWEAWRYLIARGDEYYLDN